MAIRATENSQKTYFVKKCLQKKSCQKENSSGRKLFPWLRNKIKDRDENCLGIIVILRFFTNFLFHSKTCMSKIRNTGILSLYLA